ncbi:hypothetical protein BB558_006791, partial [Smittium angustum]
MSKRHYWEHKENVADYKGSLQFIKEFFENGQLKAPNLDESTLITFNNERSLEEVEADIQEMSKGMSSRDSDFEYQNSHSDSICFQENNMVARGDYESAEDEISSSDEDVDYVSDG